MKTKLFENIGGNTFKPINELGHPEIMFRLSYDGGDVECPYCKTGFAVTDWNTEYGYPIFGDHETTCLECNKPFHFDCSIVYKSRI